MKSRKIQREEKVVLSSKGQLVIPKAIRASAHLHDGEELLLRVREDDVIELSPIRKTIEDLFSLIPKSYEKIGLTMIFY